MTTKGYALENARKTRARTVVVPPLKMAGPMETRAAAARSPLLSPVRIRMYRAGLKSGPQCARIIPAS